MSDLHGSDYNAWRLQSQGNGEIEEATLTRSTLWMGIALSLLAAGAARAEFAATNRSVNGTADTLPANTYEVGISSVSYGYSPNLMMQLPSGMMLLGKAKADLRYRVDLATTLRATPYLFAETPRYTGVGANIGWDIDSARNHVISGGGRVRYGPRPRVVDGNFEARNEADFVPNVEYDFYHGGNLFYTGIADYILYVGYTWAWQHVYVGLIASPASGAIPLPYIYWRF